MKNIKSKVSVPEDVFNSACDVAVEAFMDSLYDNYNDLDGSFFKDKVNAMRAAVKDILNSFFVFVPEKCCECGQDLPEKKVVTKSTRKTDAKKNVPIGYRMKLIGSGFFLLKKADKHGRCHGRKGSIFERPADAVYRAERLGYFPYEYYLIPAYE